MFSGNLLRSARTLAGLNQAELASKANLPRQAVVRLEKYGANSVECRATTLLKVMAAWNDVGVIVKPDGVAIPPGRIIHAG